MAKKSFKDTLSQEALNPAVMFITKPEEEVEAAATEEAAELPELGKVNPRKLEVPEGYRVNPLYIEKRSKRMQILTTNSIFERLKEKSRQTGQSVNDIINMALEEALKE